MTTTKSMIEHPKTEKTASDSASVTQNGNDNVNMIAIETENIRIDHIIEITIAIRSERLPRIRWR